MHTASSVWKYQGFGWLLKRNTKYILPPFLYCRNTATSALVMGCWQAQNFQKLHFSILWVIGNNFTIMLKSSAVALSGIKLGLKMSGHLNKLQKCCWNTIFFHQKWKLCQYSGEVHFSCQKALKLFNILKKSNFETLRL